MRTAFLIVFGLLLTGCSNPWASGYLRNPLLQQQTFAPVDGSDIRHFQFEKVQQFARYELAVSAATTRAATQPSSQPFNPLPAPSTQMRFLNTFSLTRNQVTLVGWSEFENWELLNDDEPRLMRFARQIGADYVLVCSKYVNKPAHDVYRPRTVWLDAVRPPAEEKGFFKTERPPSIWYAAGTKPDKYLYDVLFFRRK